MTDRPSPREPATAVRAAGRADGLRVPSYDHGRPVEVPLRADELIDERTSWGNLDETALGHDLLGHALAGDPALVGRLLDELRSTDRDDVSLALLTAASEPDLLRLVGTAAGRALLDRCYDEVTSGSVATAEKRQADRVITAKATRSRRRTSRRAPGRPRSSRSDCPG